MQLLKRNEVQEMAKLSRSGLYQYMKNGLFPKPVKIGIRRVAWRESDIKAWIDSRTESEFFIPKSTALTDDDIIELLPEGEWEIESTLKFARALLKRVGK